jgi:hypothetical protein
MLINCGKKLDEHGLRDYKSITIDGDKMVFD